MNDCYKTVFGSPFYIATIKDVFLIFTNKQNMEETAATILLFGVHPTIRMIFQLNILLYYINKNPNK